MPNIIWTNDDFIDDHTYIFLLCFFLSMHMHHSASVYQHINSEMYSHETPSINIIKL